MVLSFALKVLTYYSFFVCRTAEDPYFFMNFCGERVNISKYDIILVTFKIRSSNEIMQTLRTVIMDLVSLFS